MRLSIEYRTVEINYLVVTVTFSWLGGSIDSVLLVVLPALCLFCLKVWVDVTNNNM